MLLRAKVDLCTLKAHLLANRLTLSFALSYRTKSMTRCIGQKTSTSLEATKQTCLFKVQALMLIACLWF